MIAELYLIAPADAEAGALVDMLKPILATAEIAALLLPRGERSAEAYATLVRSVAPLAQAAGAAVLLEGEPGIVRTLGADGLHVGGSVAAVRAAMAALKPDFIVGAGPVTSRDEAMTKGELGLDYIMFGPLSGAIAATDREMAAWWAETMEIPGVLSDPQTIAGGADAAGCEFLALSDSVWAATDPAALVADVAASLEQEA
jgi:thiamine-phosphate pyrophosphorylase